ncbi:cytochrome P450 [Streptomyces sp. NPDC046805]|uniref:cytochrome P450 n=1 Tax=Streptomyces sp. NPDC046805 TaxID=3155134 RepID=UPI0034022C0F
MPNRRLWNRTCWPTTVGHCGVCSLWQARGRDPGRPQADPNRTAFSSERGPPIEHPLRSCGPSCAGRCHKRGGAVISEMQEAKDGGTMPDLTDRRSFLDDVPHAAFREILRRPGLYWQPTDVGTANGGFWAVTRFADIVALEKDPATFTSTQGAAYPMTNVPPDHPTKSNLMLKDPPEHSYLRRAAAKGFAPRVVANFEPWIQEIVGEVLDHVEGMREFDYVAEFAQTIPALVVARVLGMPRSDSAKLVGWANATFEAQQQVDGLSAGEGSADAMRDVVAEIVAYSERIQKAKLVEPGEDMFTELSGCVERGEISQAEFGQWMFLMMVAGFETTHTVIGQSMRMYLEDQEVASATDRAVAEGKTDRAVDEYLRLISPPMQMARTATRDVEFAGQQIRKGDVMVMYFIAANRDPSVFSDPDRFDPWRAETDTLAFGSGVHRCIGSSLAKLELRILWTEIRNRGLRLRLNGLPRRGGSTMVNQLLELPVARV